MLSPPAAIACILLGLICAIGVLWISNQIARSRLNREKRQAAAIKQENKEVNEAKKAYIKREIGFDLYSSGSVERTQQRLADLYNTNIGAYTIHNHLTATGAHPLTPLEAVLPIDTAYEILKSITKKQELLFLYK